VLFLTKEVINPNYLLVLVCAALAVLVAIVLAGLVSAALLAVLAAFEAALAALATALAALAAAFAAVFIALAAAFIALATALFALAAALLAPASPQAIPKALKAKSVESAITFFILKVILLSSSKINLVYFYREPWLNTVLSQPFIFGTLHNINISARLVNRIMVK
jgi:hypothetical protein